VRKAIEQAWFESRPLEVHYRNKNEVVATKRVIRLERIIMDRAETRLNVLDVETNEKRQLVLDRIEKAVIAG